MCESRILIIFLSFHLLNQEAEVMSSNDFPWDFIHFLDCIFCALSKQYSMVFRDEVKVFFKRGKDGKQMQKFQIVVTYHEGENEMGLQASTICEIFDFLRIFLKTHKEKEKGRNWG